MNIRAIESRRSYKPQLTNIDWTPPFHIKINKNNYDKVEKAIKAQGYVIREGLRQLGIKNIYQITVQRKLLSYCSSKCNNCGTSPNCSVDNYREIII